MTKTYDDQEPQITDPSQLIQVFEDQRLNTLRAVDMAREGMEHVKNTLNNLLQVPGQDEETVNAAWAQLKPVRQVLKKIDAVMIGAYNVIETVTEQRDELAVELADITDAIDNEDTDHERLNALATSIHRNAFVEGMNQGYESGYDDGVETGMNGEADTYDGPDEVYIESAVADAASHWNIPSKMADDIVAAIRGEIQMTNDQREAFKAFLATF